MWPRSGRGGAEQSERRPARQRPRRDFVDAYGQAAGRAFGSTRTALLTLVFAVCCQAQVPTPAAFLGFEPGTDRKLADYDQVYAYFTKLAATSDRVRFASIGKTTENHELGLAIISSAKNLATLEAIRETNLALVDPRKLKPGAEAALIAAGKTIVCLNASIHSIEVGPTQATLPLAHFLATTQDPEWLRVLDDVVLLMLPCHNPDGYLKIVDWYRRWVGTPHEGCAYPGLYHPYAGHDNNRDWFMFNLQETRLTVTEIYKKWVPQIVMDMHQMGEDGARMFTPPYQDPIEPNVDPILVERLNELGLAVQKELLGKGFKGIVNRTLFDGWSPSRSYMHYHGGVRFLCEIASARMATPIERKGLDRNATSRPDLNPVPWKGERWSLADIVRHHNEAAMAVLRHASANRTQWLTSFHEVFRKACSGTEGPAAYLIPLEDRRTADALLRLLELGQIESQVLARPISLANREVRHAIVIPGEQPFFSFARALLENTPYPTIRESPGGPIRKPYDVTAHCLPALWGFEVLQLPGAFPPELLKTRSRHEDGLPPAPLPLRIERKDALIGVYRSFVPNVMDEGWLRLFLEQSGLRYRPVTNAEVRQLGGARSDSRATELGVLILPSLTSDNIVNGNRAQDFPPEFRDGIGDEGSAAIDRFVRDGGTLIAIKDATALPIMLFKMPIRNAVSNLPEGRRLAIPGAILRVDHDFAISTVLPRKRASTIFDGGKAFEPDLTIERDQTLKPRFVGQWAPANALLLAGHAEGLDLLAEKGAIVECEIGKGRVVLFGFSPHFRCQTRGSFSLLENAIRSGIESN